MKIALVQMNPTVGDLQGNRARIAEGVRAAGTQSADLAVTPELAIPGYLPRDLLLNADFIACSWKVLNELAEELKNAPPALIGMAERNTTGIGRPLFNVAALVRGGRVERTFRKSLLPTYDVFDEDRYFEPTRELNLLELAGHKIGVTICEDVWNDKAFWHERRYHYDPVEELVKVGAQILVALNASPFTLGKNLQRTRMLEGLAQRHRISVVYVNQVGGNDDLVFDGRSCAYGPAGNLIVRGKAFEADLLVADLDQTTGTVARDLAVPEEEAWHALVLGTRDFVRKCGFQRVHLGLSGGIDSSLVAAIAAEALGPENVIGVLMPSPFSSQGSIDDALDLAKQLGVSTHQIAITPVMQAFEEALQASFAGRARDVTEENLQARIRGTLLMAFSNKFNSMLLTTGNKSELAVGYCTLYGDMNGGLGVIADVPKTMVYRISKWLNRQRGKQMIPEASITKVPSAELRPNQTDQDSLPPYDLLDQIVERHVERHKSAQELIAEGYEAETVRKVLRMIKNAEFKRKQIAPGLKITDRAFGTGWRMPIARHE